jgi:hypothetical protein
MQKERGEGQNYVYEAFNSETGVQWNHPGGTSNLFGDTNLCLNRCVLLVSLITPSRPSFL